MARVLFWLAAGLVAYTYVGYAAMVGLLARWRPYRPAASYGEAPCGDASDDNPRLLSYR